MSRSVAGVRQRLGADRPASKPPPTIAEHNPLAEDDEEEPKTVPTVARGRSSPDLMAPQRTEPTLRVAVAENKLLAATAPHGGRMRNMTIGPEMMRSGDASRTSPMDELAMRRMNSVLSALPGGNKNANNMKFYELCDEVVTCLQGFESSMNSLMHVKDEMLNHDVPSAVMMRITIACARVFRSKSELYNPLFGLMDIVRLAAAPWTRKENELVEARTKLNSTSTDLKTVSSKLESMTNALKIYKSQIIEGRWVRLTLRLLLRRKRKQWAMALRNYQRLEEMAFMPQGVTLEEPPRQRNKSSVTERLLQEEERRKRVLRQPPTTALDLFSETAPVKPTGEAVNVQRTASAMTLGPASTVGSTPVVPRASAAAAAEAARKAEQEEAAKKAALADALGLRAINQAIAGVMTPQTARAAAGRVTSMPVGMLEAASAARQAAAAAAGPAPAVSEPALTPETIITPTTLSPATPRATPRVARKNDGGGSGGNDGNAATSGAGSFDVTPLSSAAATPQTRRAAAAPEPISRLGVSGAGGGAGSGPALNKALGEQVVLAASISDPTANASATGGGEPAGAAAATTGGALSVDELQHLFHNAMRDDTDEPTGPRVKSGRRRRDAQQKTRVTKRVIPAAEAPASKSAASGEPARKTRRGAHPTSNAAVAPTAAGKSSPRLAPADAVEAAALAALGEGSLPGREEDFEYSYSYYSYSEDETETASTSVRTGDPAADSMVSNATGPKSRLVSRHAAELRQVRNLSAPVRGSQGLAAAAAAAVDASVAHEDEQYRATSYQEWRLLKAQQRTVNAIEEELEHEQSHADGHAHHVGSHAHLHESHHSHHGSHPHLHSSEARSDPQLNATARANADSEAAAAGSGGGLAAAVTGDRPPRPPRFVGAALADPAAGDLAEDAEGEAQEDALEDEATNEDYYDEEEEPTAEELEAEIADSEGGDPSNTASTAEASRGRGAPRARGRGTVHRGSNVVRGRGGRGRAVVAAGTARTRLERDRSEETSEGGFKPHPPQQRQRATSHPERPTDGADTEGRVPRSGSHEDLATGGSGSGHGGGDVLSAEDGVEGSVRINPDGSVRRGSTPMVRVDGDGSVFDTEVHEGDTDGVSGRLSAASGASSYLVDEPTRTVEYVPLGPAWRYTPRATAGTTGFPASGSGGALAPPPDDHQHHPHHQHPHHEGGSSGASLHPSGSEARSHGGATSRASQMAITDHDLVGGAAAAVSREIDSDTDDGAPHMRLVVDQSLIDAGPLEIGAPFVYDPVAELEAAVEEANEPEATGIPMSVAISLAAKHASQIRALCGWYNNRMKQILQARYLPGRAVPQPMTRREAPILSKPFDDRLAYFIKKRENKLESMRTEQHATEQRYIEEALTAGHRAVTDTDLLDAAPERVALASLHAPEHATGKTVTAAPGGATKVSQPPTIYQLPLTARDAAPPRRGVRPGRRRTLPKSGGGSADAE